MEYKFKEIDSDKTYPPLFDKFRPLNASKPDYTNYHNFLTKAPGLEVFFEGVEVIQHNWRNGIGYYHFRLQPGTNRCLAVISILATIRGFYTGRKINLQVDPALPANEVGVIVQTVDTTESLA